MLAKRKVTMPPRTQSGTDVTRADSLARTPKRTIHPQQAKPALRLAHLSNAARHAMIVPRDLRRLYPSEACEVQHGARESFGVCTIVCMYASCWSARARLLPNLVSEMTPLFWLKVVFGIDVHRHDKNELTPSARRPP